MVEPAYRLPNRLPAVAALALRPLPLLPLQLLLQGLASSIARRHPELRERLQACEERSIGVEPTDLPFVMIVEPRRDTIALHVERRLDRTGVAARIRGPFPALLGLVDGSYDGDALFFSRDIAIEGDIEAVLALRNAIDDAQLALPDEVAACFGPLATAILSATKAPIASGAAFLSRHWRMAR